MLVNDWSARDIQKFEYVPLGPFTAKNFATSISPWVVSLEALEPFTQDAPEQTLSPVADYLKYSSPDRKRKTYDIHLEVAVSSSTPQETITTRSVSSEHFPSSLSISFYFLSELRIKIAKERKKERKKERNFLD